MFRSVLASLMQPAGYDPAGQVLANPDFDTDTDWSGSKWDINGGIASCTGLSADLYQNVSLDAGTWYWIEVEVLEMTQIGPIWSRGVLKMGDPVEGYRDARTFDSEGIAAGFIQAIETDTQIRLSSYTLPNAFKIDNFRCVPAVELSALDEIAAILELDSIYSNLTI